MHRRELLAAVAVGVGTAGCLAAPVARDTPATDADRHAAGSTDRGGGSPASEGPPTTDVDLPVPASALTRAAARDAIPAVVDPAVAADWSQVAVEFDGWTHRPRLAPGDRVIGVARGGRARAYPLKLLDRHEVVNDDLAGPLLVTYCPVCRSGVVAERRVAGDPAVFGVSGLLWRSNLVMYDRPTDSYWSQLLATAVRGPRTGDRLRQVPATLSSWGAWRNRHPDTDVVLPAPRSDTVVGPVRINYNVDPYARVERIAERYPETFDYGSGEWTDTRLRRRTRVLGVVAGGRARAYPERVVANESPLADELGGVPLVVAAGPGEAMVAYDRRVDGRVLSFAPDPDAPRTYLRAGGSRWRVLSGEAVDGPLAGRRLRSVSRATPMYWFAWLGFHPDTTVYGRS